MGLAASCWYATISCGFIILSLRQILKVASLWSMMAVLVVRHAERVSMLSGCLVEEFGMVATG